ncbi:MAG: hypothetical protein JSU84_06180 [Thiotrichales bacterium]|nr:MAG: hypothetical protein JSU84_06180 [Thiotrichales bacterium]
MTTQQRFELTCDSADYEFWLNWLLNQHNGSIDVVPIRRYGLNHTQLSRSEQVQGFADYYRFSLMLAAEDAMKLNQLVSQQAHTAEVSLLSLQG